MREADQLPSSGIQQGESYYVQYEIKNYVSGSVFFKFAAATGLTHSGNGVYSEIITATTTEQNDRVHFRSSAFVGSVDNLIVKSLHSADTTPQSNHGTIYGADVRNHGYEFDGVDDYMEVDMNFNPTASDFSVAYLMKSNDVTRGDRHIVNLGRMFNEDGVWLFKAAVGNLVLQYTDDGYRTETIKAISNNTWYNVVSTYNSTNHSYVVYVDGVVEKSGTTNGLVNNAVDLYIGALRPVSEYYSFNGNIADVRIYDRALSATEVGDLYRGADVASPVGHWPLSTGAGDISGNGNAGTVTGASLVGNVASFDGVDDYVDVADINAVELTDSTFSFWAKVNTFTEDLDFITKGSHAVGVPILIWFDDVVSETADIGGGNRQALSVSSNDGSVEHFVATPTNSINDTDWHYYTIVLNPTTNQIRIYIDGALSVSNTETWSGPNATSDVIRFGDATPVVKPLDGAMSDVRIYNRVLSLKEIQQLYEQGW